MSPFSRTKVVSKQGYLYLPLLVRNSAAVRRVRVEEINELSRELLAPAKKQMTEDLLALETKYPVAEHYSQERVIFVQYAQRS